MSEREAVLFANEAFYHVFADGDLDEMDKLWAREAPVACIHPGWPALAERTRVMESWAAILTGPERPQIVCHSPEVFIHGAVACVVCYEKIESNFLVATNIFVQEAGGWMMVHHQAGATSVTDESPDDQTSSSIH